MLSADSMQVYRLMDIGTAKPSIRERKGIPHHLIDIVYPDEPFSVAQYQALARKKIVEVLDRGKVPVIVGGTGLYIKSLIDSYEFIPASPDPELRGDLERKEREQPGFLHSWLSKIDPVAAAKIHPNDHRRTIRALEVFIKTGKPISDSWRRTPLPYDVLYFALTGPRQWLYERIDRRVEQQVRDGLVAEVMELYALGYTEDLPSMQGLGYKEMFCYLRGRATLLETVEMIARNTRRFAKRQYTWFRADDRIEWIDVGKPNGAMLAVEEITRKFEGRVRQLDE